MLHSVLSQLSLAVQVLFQQHKIVFRPGVKLAKTPATLNLAFENLQLICEDGSKVHGWWVPNQKSSKTVLFFHGSDGNITHELATLHFLYALNVSVLMVDYPGYGASEGAPSEQGCYRCARAAWQFLVEQQHIHPEGIIIFGQSIGSAIGVYLAAHYQSGGLVFQSGFTSVPDLAAWLFPQLPVRPFCRIKMNSLKRIAHCHCPLLVLHSQTDEHIPIEQAYQLYARANEPKQFLQLSGSHFSHQWQQDAEVRGAWKRLLSRQAEQWGQETTKVV